MPAIPFNFYQRAYRINQAFNSSILSTSSIKMGSIISPNYKGIAFYHSKSLYADVDSAISNYNLFDANLGTGSPEYYNNNFFTSVGGRNHQAAYLYSTDIGPATPKLNQEIQLTWDQVCYPCALGDTRDNIPWGDYRDGSWVEAGYVSGPNRNYVNIYTADASGGSPRWTNSIQVNSAFEATSRNTRVFTSPALTSDNIPGLGLPPGYQFIVYFGWDFYGNGGAPIFHYELFAFDYVSNILSSVNAGIDLTTSYGFYEDFNYTGKHDIFYTAQWMGIHSYRMGVDFLIFLTPGSGGKAWQMDLAGGSLTPRNASAAAYSDVYDILCTADNISRAFYTWYGKFGFSSPSIDSVSVPYMNVFDGDYRPFPTGVLGGTNDEYFYFGDDQQSSLGKIVGWSVRFDSGGMLSTGGYGAYDQGNTYAGGPYTLKRVVAVAPMQLIVGPGPGLGVQNLMRVACGWHGGLWYRAGSVFTYPSTSQHEDFVAMDHGYCEDYTGYFHPSGQYQSGLPQGLKVGAGNQHILSISSLMESCLLNQNTGSDYDLRAWSPPLSSGDHYNYVLYLGSYVWTAANTGSHTNNAYLYITITGGSNASPFLNPVSSPGGPVTFAGANGKVRFIAFYA